MTGIWLEMKYGRPDRDGALLCRIHNDFLLRLAKAKILKDAYDRAMISESTDAILGILDRGDYEKLRKLLDFLVPEEAEHKTGPRWCVGAR